MSQAQAARTQALQRLCQAIGYSFTDQTLLELALTHRSANKVHNERLEFLGDAVLGMIIAKALYQRFPNVPEGKLTRMRASLVKGETLADLGKELALGELLNLGPGELKSGGHRRGSILADAVEAIIGAIYLEAGLEQISERVLSWFAERIEALDPNAHPKDSKTRLQEYLQARQLPLPDYQVSEVLGKSHAQTFVVSCTCTGLNEPVIARGSSRRRAEQEAAAKALKAINHG